MTEKRSSGKADKVVIDLAEIPEDEAVAMVMRGYGYDEDEALLVVQHARGENPDGDIVWVDAEGNRVNRDGTPKGDG